MSVTRTSARKTKPADTSPQRRPWQSDLGDAVMTPEQVCAELDIGETTLRELRKAGVIRCFKVGQAVRFLRSQFLEDMRALAARGGVE